MHVLYVGKYYMNMTKGIVLCDLCVFFKSYVDFWPQGPFRHFFKCKNDMSDQCKPKTWLFYKGKSLKRIHQTRLVVLLAHLLTTSKISL